MSEYDWTKATIIEKQSLGEYIYQVGDNSEKNIHLSNYCIQIKPSGYAFDQFGEFLQSNFVYYVFSQEKITRMQELGKAPRIKAQEKAGFSKQYQQDGTLGEFLLFLFTDGFFEIPMISHKIDGKQSFSHEVFGCDNLFFGSFNDQECIGIGEAKVYNNVTNGLRSAIGSISEFHNEQSKTYLDQELHIAPKNLSENLSQEQIEHLAEILTVGYDEYPILHPIFICYEDDSLAEVEDVTKSHSQKKKEIRDAVDSINPLQKIKHQVENGEDRLSRAYLLFLLLPVPDLNSFRRRMLTAINPGFRIYLDSVDDDQVGEKV